MSFRATWVASLAFALSLLACENQPPPPPRQPITREDLGLKVVRAGENPAAAPGTKGVMMDIDNQEVKVLVVPPGSPADDAGFQAGDILLMAGGREVSSEDDLAAALKDAGGRKIIYEVRQNRELGTLSMATTDPGWIVLSGDSFRGFLMGRLGGSGKPEVPGPGKAVPDFSLPTFDRAPFRLSSLRGKLVALLFFGTFSEPCYAHMQALHKACLRNADKLHCVAIDTMELFTAVGKTVAFQAELVRVRKDLWPERLLPIDLFMEGENRLGVTKLPTLVLLDKEGKIVQRFDGPMQNPATDIDRAVDALLAPGGEKGAQP